MAGTAEQISHVQRELVWVGIDRPTAAATGDPAAWIRPGDRPASFPRARFADLAAVRERGEQVLVLDVRRDAERAGGLIDGSVHIPIHELAGRVDEVPDGVVWVHCAGGMRAAIAASLLDAVGRDVVAVDDGFDAAVAAGLTLTGPEGADRTTAGTREGLPVTGDRGRGGGIA